MTGPLETVKKALQAYVDKDRALIDPVIGKPYSFTSRGARAVRPLFDRFIVIADGRLPAPQVTVGILLANTGRRRTLWDIHITILRRMGGVRGTQAERSAPNER
ncbi:hypothetical protein [Mesorhizobium kowhaii]|uniref:hypothetical protein n=1 Tax=Mesorhizobium kowhaii TaxID=1300272 RepID=UPI001ABF89C5|nr:hypothetical protein [Mesorhizobium kowhaii]